MKLSTLIALNAKTDRLVQFSYDDEDQKKGHFLRNTAIGVGALGVADNAAAYAAGRGVEGPVRSGLRGILDTRQKGIDRVGRWARTVGDNLGKAMPSMKGVAGAFKGVKFSDRHERLVQLNARLDGLIQFGKEPDEDDAKGAKGKKKTKGKPFIFGKKK